MRELAILDAAIEELAESSVDGMSMLGVAKRAGASKETLYSWFGDKDGLVRALIIRNADQAAERVQGAFEGGKDLTETLVGFSIGLLTLLTGESSVAINRAAMSSPELATTLLESGRFRVGPIVEGYLLQAHKTGQISAPNPAKAFELLYGLVIQDSQIRVLLGETPPSTREIKLRAKEAVTQFLLLTQPE